MLFWVKMTQIKLDLDEGQTKIVNMCKLVNSLDSKDKAISKIILDWGKLQSLSTQEIHKKIIEYFKNRWSEKNTHDKRNWIKDAEERLKNAYKEYSKKVDDFPGEMAKKYNVPKKFVDEFMDEENWTDEEDNMDDKEKSAKKIKVKIFNDFQSSISEWQSELGKKYNCEIEHDECFWVISYKFGPLTVEYSGGKESYFYLDSYINEVIIELTKILRGSKSLREIMDENKAYLEKVEKEADNVSPEEEAEMDEEADAMEELYQL